MNAGVIQILLVEDNPGDVDLTREEFAATSRPHALHVATDGKQALDFVRSPDLPKPDLILLDLNLPKVDGIAVLREIKSDEALRAIPVIVLTSSLAESDVRLAYELGANSYVPKSVDIGGFEETVRAIEQFWFSVAKLPNR